MLHTIIQNPIEESIIRDLNINYIATLTTTQREKNEIQYFSSNVEWGNLYYKDKLILDCPLVKAGLKISAPEFVLPWQCAPARTKRESMITNMRKSDFKIIHGISFVSNIDNVTTSIALGTSYDCADFYNELMHNSNKLINLVRTLNNELIISNQKVKDNLLCIRGS